MIMPETYKTCMKAMFNVYQIHGLINIIICSPQVPVANISPLYEVCVCVIGVLRRFRESKSHITTVAACCMRRVSARVLSATDTNAPCRQHETQMHHPVTFS